MNGNKTALINVIGFLCVSLDSSAVQLHDILGGRLACACSEAGFSSQNGDRASSSEEYRSVVHYLETTGPNTKNIHKATSPVRSGKCLSRKAVHN
jgi:hypothetical protein